VAAQCGAGVLVAEQPSLTQQRHHLLGEIVELSGQPRVVEDEAVAGARGEPFFDLVCDLFGRTGDAGAPAIYRAVQELSNRGAAVVSQRPVAGQGGLVGLGAIGKSRRGHRPIEIGAGDVDVDLQQPAGLVLGAEVVVSAWIGPVLDAVDTYLPVFRDAFDDETTWGPAKQVGAALTERGVDLTDWHAVDNAIHQLNAEQLAHQLLP
jgi:hypothetical protein